jgi:hypothetical protein
MTIDFDEAEKSEEVKGFLCAEPGKFYKECCGDEGFAATCKAHNNNSAKKTANKKCRGEYKMAQRTKHNKGE